MAKSQEEHILIGANDEIIELTGADKEAFLIDKEERIVQFKLREAEYEAKKQKRIDAINKLATVAGLTEEEINAIL